MPSVQVLLYCILIKTHMGDKANACILHKSMSGVHSSAVLSSNILIFINLEHQKIKLS